MKRKVPYKFWYFIFILITNSVLGQQLSFPNSKLPQNKIIIIGKSNLQTFTIRYYFREQPKQTISIDTNSCSLIQTELQIPVRELLFSNRYMRKDFLQLIRSNEYPVIKIFYTPKIFKGQITQQKKIISITIQITGVQKTYQVPVLFIGNNRAYTEMKGEVRIRFSDFHLKPKKYILGLIRIQETVRIEFILYF